jgi:hypothetical protein
MKGERDCPECDGNGWVVGSDIDCCGQSDWECGGRGCVGPEQIQVQEQCAQCGGGGIIEEAGHDH